MSDTEAQRIAAGVSFLFAHGDRPDAGTWRRIVGECQARAEVVREEPDAGRGELVLNGLAFDVAGLAPAPGFPAPQPLENRDFASELDASELEAVALYPGHHLSGGVRMMPVIRSLLALAAEIAVKLPVRGVIWHPAATLIAPQEFAHRALAWLAGAAFPGGGLVAFTASSDGSIASRGLAHFTGQELMLRNKPSESPEDALRLASQLVDRLVSHGEVTAITEWEIAGEALCLEPARRADQLWIWRKDEKELRAPGV